MKIVISSFGTRGDIQPYLALAVGLKRAGHQVTLVTSYTYTDWIESYGITTRPTRFSMQDFMQSPEVQAALKSNNFLRQMKLMQNGMRENAESQKEVWAALEDAEFFIQSPTASGALEALELHQIPVAFASPIPFAPTRAHPSFFMGNLRPPSWAGLNYLTHQIFHGLLWNIMGAPLTNPLRKKLGLKPLGSYAEILKESRRRGVPWLYGFSSHVIPKPIDWDVNQHITGYWFLEAPTTWQPPANLLQFLESGSPPIYFGFGSISLGDGETKSRLILRALELTGQRGIILTGWGGLSQVVAPPHIMFVENVPHDWLFPRMAAVLHHGGAGSTSAGLRAGVPSLITPLGGDQGAWAERVVQLGVGPRVGEIKNLTPEKLAAAINLAVHDAGLRTRAAALGEKVRAENGVARAIEIIEQHAKEFKSSTLSRQ